jgi:Peptidase A4 family
VKRMLMAATVLATSGLTCMAGLGGVAGAASTGAGTTSATFSGVNPGGPVVRAQVSGNSGLPTISLNWSGYAAMSPKKFNYVHSTFVQPKLTCPGIPNQWTSNWAGLDGFTSQTVEQDGTFATCGGAKNKTPQYIAWYELYPAPAIAVFNVKPGDVMSATVRYAHGKFALTIADKTSGKSATHVAACSTCLRDSAEWIVERPALCNSTSCFLTRLADFGTTVMSDNTAQVAGRPVAGIGGFNNDPIFMVSLLKSGGFISLDEVSSVVKRAFEAVWERTGVPTPLG